MQPDYKREVQGIVQQWYDAAGKKEIDSTERKQLCQNTDQVVKTLRELKNSGQIEKVKALSQILIKKFNERSSGDRDLLAQLVVRHKGAYKSLHQLFQLVAEINNYPQAFTITNRSLPPGHLSDIVTLNATALNCLATNQPWIPKITEIERLILSNLDLKSIVLFGQTSKHHNKLVKSYLVDLLNFRIIRISNLGLNSITEIINYFGKDNCSKITNLDLTGVYKKTVHKKQTSSLYANKLDSAVSTESSESGTESTESDTGGIKSLVSFDGSASSDDSLSAYDSANTDDSVSSDDSFYSSMLYSAKIESISITECFPNLTHFTLCDYFPLEELSIETLCLPANLESLVLSGNRGEEYEKGCQIVGWSSIGKFKSLKHLDISGNAINVDLAFLEKLDSLKFINLSKNSFYKAIDLKNKSKLEVLNIKDTMIKNISFIKELPLLETFLFGNKSWFDKAALKVLKECPSIKQLEIHSPPLEEQEYLDFLKLPNLEYLHLICIEGSDFLPACTSLKGLNCILKDLTLLKNCTEISNLSIRGSDVDLNKLPDLKKLKRIKLEHCTVNNLSNLEKFPLLNTLVLDKCEGVSDEQVKILTSKGINVKIS